MLHSTDSKRGSGAGQSSWVRLTLAGTLLAVLLSGCVVRVVYNQLDWLTLWYVDDYFEFNATQKTQARELIAHTLAWHRSSQLPRYVTISRTVHDRVGAPVSAAFIAGLYADTVGLWDELLRKVATDAGGLLRSLSDSQVEVLFERLAEDNLEFEEEYSGGTAAERRAKQDKAIIKMFRRFTGRLSGAQEELIRSRTAQLHDLSAEWLHRRAAWQAQFRVLLTGRKSDPQFVNRLANLMLDPNQFDSPGYRELVEDNQRQVFSLVAEVLSTLSPAQTDAFRKRLAGFMQDFDALIREGGANSTANKKAPEKGGLLSLVPRRGLEPPLPFDNQHLKLARLPIPPSGHFTN
jgi:hypothetical protein